MCGLPATAWVQCGNTNFDFTALTFGVPTASQCSGFDRLQMCAKQVKLLPMGAKPAPPPEHHSLAERQPTTCHTSPRSPDEPPDSAGARAPCPLNEEGAPICSPGRCFLLCTLVPAPDKCWCNMQQQSVHAQGPVTPPGGTTCQLAHH